MPVSSRLITLACAVATLLLAGCHTVVDAHWANSDDTVDYWNKAMSNLPVEVRGQWPDATNQQLARVIPNAKAMNAIDGRDTGITKPRLVLELGRGAKPKDDAYCAEPASGTAASAPQAQMAMTLAICDGTRLVAMSSKLLDPAKTPVSELPRRLDSLKKLALIGIARSQADAYQIQG